MQPPPINPASPPLGRLPLSQPTTAPTSATQPTTVVTPGTLSPANVALGDLAAFTGMSLAQASELRVQMLLNRVAELLLQLEGELYRLLDIPRSPGGETGLTTQPSPSPPTAEPAPGGQSQMLPAGLPLELVSRVSKLIARLAQVAPERAEMLLAKYQMQAKAFPESMQALMGQLGEVSEPSLEALVRGLLQPPPGGRVAQVPSLPIPPVLSDVLLQPELLEQLLKFASEVAEKTRVGESQTEPLQGRSAAPPTGDAMDGITSTVMSTRPGAPGATQGSSLTSPLPNPTLEAASTLYSQTSVDVSVDVVTLSPSASRFGPAGGSAVSFTGIDIMVNVNQILGEVLGEENPLWLSSTQIGVGVSLLSAQGQRPQSPLDGLARDFAQQLVELRQTDPATFEKVIGLLRALAKLNPGKFDQMLSRIESQLRGIVASQQEAASGARAPAVAAAPVAEMTGGGGRAVAGHTITVTVDVAVGQRTDMVIADLRSAGFEAQAMQGASVTQVQVQVTIGPDGEVQRTDPLIIDLQGDGVDLTGRETAFDIDADGGVERTSFVQGDDALLMIDQNADGRLTDGSELFGDQEGDPDGFAKLARFDDNRDGVIDARDAVFEKLRVIYDRNRDGVTDLTELAGLGEVGIDKISLSRAAAQSEDVHGNLIRDRAEVTRADGSTTSIHEVDLTHE